MRSVTSGSVRPFARWLGLLVWVLIPGLALHARWSTDFDGKGAAEAVQSLQRLTTIASVMHTGAHPDDEDSGMLAYLARAANARTSYLALTRGDGGQNLIGAELYDALGVLRTEELQAARRIDGAEQYFTQSYDFGFSKSAQEALSKWGREATLGDMVRVIRMVRPLVIISRFSGTPADGHGHHQAAGLLTPEAFRAAADPKRFPEHLAEGLRPWQARKLYRHAVQSQSDVRINTGEYSPLWGRSFYQIGIEGRNMHRCQAQGQIPQKGEHWSYLRRLETKTETNGRGAEVKEAAIFDGIDTSLTGVTAFAGNEVERVPFLASELRSVQQSAEQGLRSFKPSAPHEAAEQVLSGLQRLETVRARVEQSGLSDAVKYDILFLLNKKLEDFRDAANATLGLSLDTLAVQPLLIPGQTAEVSLHFLNRSPVTVTPVAVEVAAPRDWAQKTAKVSLKPVGYNESWQGTFTLTVAGQAAYTQPYWLQQPRRGDRFLVDAARLERGKPFSAPEVIGRVRYQAFGVENVIEQPLQYRYTDRALGEVRKPAPVVPPISVAMAPELLALPTAPSAQERAFEVTVMNNRRQRTEGTVRLTVPAGWRAQPAAAPFIFEREGEKQAFRFRVEIPPGIAAGSYKLEATADLEGRTYVVGYSTLSYPHITPRNIYRPATARVEAMDVRVADGLKVGYVMGSGDNVPQALAQMGVPVVLLTLEDLGSGDLRSYTAIVIGIRAYAVRDDLRAYHQRLMEYVRDGGLMVVQYHTSEFPAPYPLRLGRGERVSVEEAPVRILEPDHPLFRSPNRITARDFDGWVQERGLNFMSEWGSPFRPLLASNDPGEPERLGGHLVASYGRGTYIYTGYAWFRQLPAGVPGAYRLFANLISLPKAR